MRVGRIVSIAVVSLASIIVLAAAAIAIRVLASSRSGEQQNFPPAPAQQAASPDGDTVLISQPEGSSSFLYRKSTNRGTSARLTSAKSGIESEASFSHDGKLVVYSFAATPDSKSAIWVVGIDGRNPHAITNSDADALHPVFSPDDSRVFYALSGFTGHYSPIVRPTRHDWDVFSTPVATNATTAGAAPTQVTRASLYDLYSVDASADGITPSGIKILISTSGYPIGALLEEFNLGSTGRDKIFQPHVPGEPSVGPAFGEARFIHGGMDIVFLAATDTAGGNYDYNVFSMSDVTGSDIKQLTHLKGMTKELRVLPDGKATFVNGGAVYVLDLSTGTVKPL